MTLTKNQKVLLGVGALAVAGYMIYRNSRKSSFANLTSRISSTTLTPGCPCTNRFDPPRITEINGVKWELCAGTKGTVDGMPDKMCRVGAQTAATSLGA
jgi:hypothetical protein